MVRRRARVSGDNGWRDADELFADDVFDDDDLGFDDEPDDAPVSIASDNNSGSGRVSSLMDDDAVLVDTMSGDEYSGGRSAAPRNNRGRGGARSVNSARNASSARSGRSASTASPRSSGGRIPRADSRACNGSAVSNNGSRWVAAGSNGHAAAPPRSSSSERGYRGSRGDNADGARVGNARSSARPVKVNPSVRNSAAGSTIGHHADSTSRAVPRANRSVNRSQVNEDSGSVGRRETPVKHLVKRNTSHAPRRRANAAHSVAGNASAAQSFTAPEEFGFGGNDSGGSDSTVDAGLSLPMPTFDFAEPSVMDDAFPMVDDAPAVDADGDDDYYRDVDDDMLPSGDDYDSMDDSYTDDGDDYGYDDADGGSGDGSMWDVAAADMIDPDDDGYTDDDDWGAGDDVDVSDDGYDDDYDDGGEGFEEPSTLEPVDDNDRFFTDDDEPDDDLLNDDLFADYTSDGNAADGERDDDDTASTPAKHGFMDMIRGKLAGLVAEAKTEIGNGENNGEDNSSKPQSLRKNAADDDSGDELEDDADPDNNGDDGNGDDSVDADEKESRGGKKSQEKNASRKRGGGKRPSKPTGIKDILLFPFRFIMSAIRAMGWLARILSGLGGVFVILLIVWLVVNIGVAKAPMLSSLTAHDEGTVTVDSATYDNGEATITLRNNSDMIAHGTGTANVLTWDPLNNFPSGIIKPSTTATCTVPDFDLEPDETTTVTAPCTGTAEGIWKRVQVSIEYN